MADGLAEERVYVGFAKMTGGPARDDERLIRDFIAGRDPVLFEELVRAHLPWLRRLLFAVFRGVREDMEDAEQEILIGIYSDVRRYRFESGFKTFFYRYARNKAIDLLRKSVRRNRKEAGPVPEETAGRERSPEEEYLRRERKEDVANRLLDLTGEEREILLMKDVEGFSIEEISAATGRKPGTVKSLLHRTREKFFRLLERG
jgi:RNA polymerase sigma-70 factor (ECF subfamily)